MAAFNAGGVDAVCALCAPDAVIYGVLGGGPVEVARPIWKELHDAYAIKLTIDELIAEGDTDTVAVRYTETGVSRAPFRGGPVTGKSYSVVAMEWFKFREGKIVARWGARDYASILRQLGHAG